MASQGKSEEMKSGRGISYVTPQTESRVKLSSKIGTNHVEILSPNSMLTSES